MSTAIFRSATVTPRVAGSQWYLCTQCALSADYGIDAGFAIEDAASTRAFMDAAGWLERTGVAAMSTYDYCDCCGHAFGELNDGSLLAAVYESV